MSLQLRSVCEEWMPKMRVNCLGLEKGCDNVQRYEIMEKNNQAIYWEKIQIC